MKFIILIPFQPVTPLHHRRRRPHSTSSKKTSSISKYKHTAEKKLVVFIWKCAWKMNSITLITKAQDKFIALISFVQKYRICLSCYLCLEWKQLKKKLFNLWYLYLFQLSIYDLDYRRKNKLTDVCLKFWDSHRIDSVDNWSRRWRNFSCHCRDLHWIYCKLATQVNLIHLLFIYAKLYKWNGDEQMRLNAVKIKTAVHV